jgi:lipopolysaccharide/colanic/teichoic acid biosynthesis glycosyltransferase
MNRSNAVSVSESTRYVRADGEHDAQRESVAIVYAWRPAQGHLAAATDRAFSFRYQFLKRTLDVIVSSLLLVLLFPLGLILALLVALTSRGPVFYCEQRVGRFRTPFSILKFRSMYTSLPKSKVFEISPRPRIDHEVGRLRKKMHDPRITPVGRVLRRMSLDELPQLWNVLMGDMSLVGPRPIVEGERHLYGPDLPYYDLFRPGISGLWQVSGRSEVDYERRVRLDREYASRWSCWLDFVILARTIPAVISMRGAY